MRLNPFDDRDTANSFMLARLIRDLTAAASIDRAPFHRHSAGLEPLDEVVREFFENNWNLTKNFLKQTKRIAIFPEPGSAPASFRFQLHLPFLSLRDGTTVETMPEPITGEIHYRLDFLTHPGEPAIALIVDRTLHFLHPNYNRETGLVCLGAQHQLGDFPITLDRFIECTLYPILSYQNLSLINAADREAAVCFAAHPQALAELLPVPPLF